MAKWLKRLMESEEDKNARQMAKFSQTPEFKEMLKAQAAELIEETKRKKDEEQEKLREKVEKAEETISLLTQDMQDSTEPYVIIRSMDFTPEKGIGIQLDYNDAFIKYLVASGINGRNEDEIVRHWLAVLSHNIVQESIEHDYIMNGVSEDEMPLGEFADILREIQAEQDDDDDEDELDNRWE